MPPQSTGGSDSFPSDPTPCTPLIAGVALALVAALLSMPAAAGGRVYGLLDQGIVGGFGKRITAAQQDQRHNWGFGNGTDMRTNYTSRFGIEASEALSGGTQIETRIEATIDPNHAFSFDRHVYIGLNGELGTLRIGRTRDLINGAASRFDPFTNDGLVEDKILLAQLGGTGLFRLPNAVTWFSPQVDGYQLAAQYGGPVSEAGTHAMKLLLTRDSADHGWHAGIDLPSREPLAGAGRRFRYGPDARHLIAGAWQQVGRIRIGGQLMHATRDMNGPGVDPALTRPDVNPWGFIGTARIPLQTGELKLALVSSDQVFNKAGVWQPIREIGGGYELFLSKQTMIYFQLGYEAKSGGGHWHGGLYQRF